jgi:hypothetical protein
MLWAVALAAVPCRAAPGATDLSARLSADATAFVEQLVGRGRGRVLVALETRRVETHTERELSTPVEGGLMVQGMPGYVRGKRRADSVLTTRDTSLLTDDLQIARMRATAVLDATLPGDQVEAVQRLLPQFLLLDRSRGDELSVVAAPMRPPWLQALAGPEGTRAALLAGAALLSALLLCLTLYLIAARSARALSRALERREPPAAPAGGAAAFGALPPGSGGLDDDALPALSERGEG